MIARARRLLDHPAAPPLLLAGVAVLAYGLLFPFLGLYWDEWPMTWIAHRLGPDGLARYFSTNRPYWGMIYRLTTPLLGFVPWHWQLFGLFWRWMTAFAAWGALRQVWPRSPAPALWAALLFLVYPGFTQQPAGMLYGHFFVVLSAFLLSLWACLKAVRILQNRQTNPGGSLRLSKAVVQEEGIAFQSAKPAPMVAVVLTILALVLSLVNLMAMEYFFTLELLRAALIGAVVWEAPDAPRRGALVRRALRHSLPYLALFMGVALWRAFFFRYQTQNYDIGLMDQVRAAPLAALGSLIGGALRDLFQVTLAAWARPFFPANFAGLGARSLAAWAAVTLAALALVGLFLLLRASRSDSDERRWPRTALGLGLLGLLLAGPPFWLTRLVIHLDYPNNRFTLPFLLGASLTVTGLIGLIPGRRLYRAGLVALLAAAAVGYQFQQGVSYQRDWKMHNTLFWQMQWRMPALQPGTTLLSSNLPLRYYSDNSLAGPLNWVYGADAPAGTMPYMFYFASVRSERRPLFQPGQPIEQDYLAATFRGSTDQMVAITFSPPGCLRVLEPDLDAANPMLPELMRQAAPLSNPGWILPAGSPAALTPEIFGPEPARGWCYFFEQADLARQQGDWAAVARLGDQAFAGSDYPNDPMERLPFIEGYAHVGNWGRAGELTRESDAITPLMRPILCKLWGRIAAHTAAPEAAATLSDLACAP